MHVNAGVNHWGEITTARLSSVEWCWIFHGIFEDQVGPCVITVLLLSFRGDEGLLLSVLFSSRGAYRLIIISA